MSDCCCSSPVIKPEKKKHRCPANGLEYSIVSSETILFHIKEPWNWKQQNQGYYFCDAPDCDVVYFGDDDSVIRHSDLKTSVGIKKKSSEFKEFLSLIITALSIAC